MGEKSVAWGDVTTWWYDWAKGKLFRVWKKGDSECRYRFIKQVIEMGNDVLLGLSTYDEEQKDFRLPGSLEFCHLSQINFEWREPD